MHASADRLDFAPPPAPGLLRALGLAMLAHAFLLAALTWGVHWKRETVTLTAEAELWSAMPQAAAPRLLEVPAEPAPPAPTRAAQPAPESVRPEPPRADIAVKREKLRLKKEQQELEKQRLQKQQQEKLQQDKLLLEKKRLQQQREQERQTAENKKKAAQEAQRKEALKAQQDAQKLEAQRQANIRRMTGLAGATGASTATGTARQSSGPSASYAGRIRASIKPNIVFTEEIVGNPLAEVEVRTAPTGRIISSKLLTPSGVKSWDEAVLKAIDKTADLPRDVDGRVPTTLVISFRPRD